MRIYTRYQSLTPMRRWVFVAYGIAGVIALAVIVWMLRPREAKSPSTPAKRGDAVAKAPAPEAKIPPPAVKVPPPLAPSTLVATSIPPRVVVSNPASPLVISNAVPPVASGVLSTTIPPAAVAQSNAVPSPANVAAPTSRPVQNVFEAQILLARQGLSSGSVDGVLGAQTRSALRVFQERERLPVTGELDSLTRLRLRLEGPPVVGYVVTAEDMAGLRPLSPTWLGKSLQDRLGYESILELVAERSRSHPNLVRRLNPGLDWTNIVAGSVVQLPNLMTPSPGRMASRVRIHLASRTLQVFDAATNLVAHYPCSIASKVEKRPVGELHVAVLAPNPNYTFNPEVFPESAEARQIGRKLILPPGPNNPVGSAWIGLDRPGYGIHGTPRPEEVGRTESHGCFRLANWNVEQLVRMVRVGTPVVVEP